MSVSSLPHYPSGKETLNGIKYSLIHKGHVGQRLFSQPPIKKAHLDAANTWITPANSSVKPHVCCLTSNYSQWAPVPNSSGTRSLSASISTGSRRNLKFSELSPQRQMYSSETDSVTSFAFMIDCCVRVCQWVALVGIFAIG